MSDQFVLQAQKYLNNTYQNNSQWVMLTENGLDAAGWGPEE